MQLPTSTNIIKTKPPSFLYLNAVFLTKFHQIVLRKPGVQLYLREYHSLSRKLLPWMIPGASIKALEQFSKPGTLVLCYNYLGPETGLFPFGPSSIDPKPISGAKSGISVTHFHGLPCILKLDVHLTEEPCIGVPGSHQASPPILRGERERPMDHVEIKIFQLQFLKEHVAGHRCIQNRQ
jgi:hypothetical protein